MKQYLFEEKNQKVWQELEAILVELESRKKKLVQKNSIKTFSDYYRQVCSHFAIAKTRQYSPHLVERLHDLVMRAHHHLYASKHFVAWKLIQFVVVDFPVALRKNARLFWLTTALLYVPFLVVGYLCYNESEMVYTVMSEEQVYDFELMYGPAAESLGRVRSSSTDLMMFGYYIKHNIGIGFRTFAGGLLAGVLTVISLLFNGVFFGAVAGYLTQIGYTENFWTFVAGHSSFELTAICICGAAGLRLAYALFAPGRMKRIDALRFAAREAVIMVMGAAVMLVAAAFIEAFWSSNRMFSPTIKYSVAAFFWLCVIAYLSLSGRRYAD